MRHRAGLILVAAVLLSCKNAPPVADGWQKTKECAAQAEVIRGKDTGVPVEMEKSVRELARALSDAGKLQAFVATARSGKVVPAVPIEVDKSSKNHYSPKYGKCFVTFTYVMNNAKTDSKMQRTYSTILLDAFEGSLLATLDFGDGTCFVGGESATCAKAQSTIADAMQN